MEQMKTLYQNENPVSNDAFDRVIAEIHMKKQSQNINSFLLCGCEPGVGTTSIAISLAISMANAGWKTILIDADLRKLGKAKRLNKDVQSGLSEYLQGEDEWENVVCNTNYSKLQYVGSGFDNGNVVSLLCSASMKELLLRLKKEYDYVIIDVPSLATALDASVLSAEVDSVVLVTSHMDSHKKTIIAAKKQLDRIGANIAGIIVNKVGAGEYKRVMKNYDYFKNKRYITKKEN